MIQIDLKNKNNQVVIGKIDHEKKETAFSANGEEIAVLAIKNHTYEVGVKLVTTLKNKLSAFTNAATVLGVTVIGALIPSVVKATVPFVYKKDGVELVIQDTLDAILPSLVPVLLVLLTYWMLGQKKLNSTRVIWIILILSIALSAFGILA